MIQIPQEIVNYARKHCRYIPGDFPSIACSQWALESGWGKAPGLGGVLYRDHLNAFCIKVAQDRRFQAGEHQGHATYLSLEACFWDRRRILTMYQKKAGIAGILHWDVLTLLDTWWAPDQDYKSKLIEIIQANKLWTLDPIASP